MFLLKLSAFDVLRPGFVIAPPALYTWVIKALVLAFPRVSTEFALNS